MSIIDKIQKANNGQKVIFTLWILLAFLWGRSWAIADYDEVMIVFYIPIAALVLALPAGLLYKVWGDTTEKPKAIEPDKRHCENCGGKVTHNSKFCESCGTKQLP